MSSQSSPVICERLSVPGFGVIVCRLKGPQNLSVNSIMGQITLAIQAAVSRWVQDNPKITVNSKSGEERENLCYFVLTEAASDIGWPMQEIKSLNTRVDKELRRIFFDVVTKQPLSRGRAPVESDHQLEVCLGLK